VAEPGQNIHLPLSKKKPSGPENGWAFLSTVLFRSDLPLIDNHPGCAVELKCSIQ
jgi:hypothetical protein